MTATKRFALIAAAAVLSACAGTKTIYDGVTTAPTRLPEGYVPPAWITPENQLGQDNQPIVPKPRQAAPTAPAPAASAPASLRI